MGHVIAIANQKGGVGKSTSTANIAAALKERGKRVLMIDMDPQATLTKRYGQVNHEELEQQHKTIYYGLVHRKPFSEILVGENPALIASNIRLNTGSNEILTGNYWNKHGLLKRGLTEILDAFDYALIDCPPRIDLLTVNALCAANGVLIPTIADYDSMLGIEDLMKLIDEIKTEVNHTLDVIGILPTLFHPTHNADRAYLEQLSSLLEGYEILEAVPYSTRYKQGTQTGQPTLEVDPTAPGVTAYKRVADHLLSIYG
ncbi:MAG: ParA family protein [Gammaproteobacteria bacterium]|nr:ParA family protein [Gammaproteobacteria bacterium]